MIRELRLRNFKCFDQLALTFSDVNILTGLNGMGKSTILQSILLLAQSNKSIESEHMLKLKGEYVNLGTGQDVLCEKADEDEIGITVQIDDNCFTLLSGYIPEADALPVEIFDVKGDRGMFQRLSGYLFYLSAYRIEPQFLYRIENEKELMERYFGKNGEYAIQYLKMHGSEEVRNPALMSENGETITDQVRKWLDLISPGVSPVININMSSRTAELLYEYIEDREKTNSYKSVNTGFGITYVLPVVVMLISAKPGDIIIIENPEAHIHPRGQRMLGELIAEVGAGGVQVIIETHSDHILNGIRVAVKRGRLRPEQTGLFFFYKDTKNAFMHKVMCPKLDQNGRLDTWPEGFFDEWDNALLELL